MEVKERIDCLVQLGDEIKEDLKSEAILDTMIRASNKNPWFTLENVQKAVQSIATEFLNRRALEAMVNRYAINGIRRKKVGLVLAGNIPAVGFHDILCTFICNHTAVIKYSSKDDVIIPALLGKLTQIDSRVSANFDSVEKLSDYDAVIATGGNNTSRYFEYYFRNVDHIIRRSRSSVAVLNGEETEEDLVKLGDDITSYFGLGCRNVSQILVPEKYDLTVIMKVTEQFKELNNHNKYRNNYDYNMALYLLNKEPFLNNETLLLKESDEVASRIACVHYQRYDSVNDLNQKLELNKDDIQCVVSHMDVDGYDVVPFGKAQQPGIFDYADGIDTVQFLLSL